MSSKGTSSAPSMSVSARSSTPVSPVSRIWSSWKASQARSRSPSSSSNMSPPMSTSISSAMVTLQHASIKGSKWERDSRGVSELVTLPSGPVVSLATCDDPRMPAPIITKILRDPPQLAFQHRTPPAPCYDELMPGAVTHTTSGLLHGVRSRASGGAGMGDSLIQYSRVWVLQQARVAQCSNRESNEGGCSCGPRMGGVRCGHALLHPSAPRPYQLARESYNHPHPRRDIVESDSSLFRLQNG